MTILRARGAKTMGEGRQGGGEGQVDANHGSRHAKGVEVSHGRSQRKSRVYVRERCQSESGHRKNDLVCIVEYYTHEVNICPCVYILWLKTTSWMVIRTRSFSILVYRVNPQCQMRL